MTFHTIKGQNVQQGMVLDFGLVTNDSGLAVEIHEGEVEKITHIADVEGSIVFDVFDEARGETVRIFGNETANYPIVG